MTAFVWYSQRFDTRNRREMHSACNKDLADYTTRRTTPAPDPHQSTLRRMCHLYSAGLPAQCLVKLQFRDRLCIDTHIVQQLIMPGFRCQFCRLVKLKFRDQLTPCCELQPTAVQTPTLRRRHQSPAAHASCGTKHAGWPADPVALMPPGTVRSAPIMCTQATACWPPDKLPLQATVLPAHQSPDSRTLCRLPAARQF